MRNPQLRLSLGQELIVDNFAGGGGASLGIEQGFGCPVDIAINHDPEALAMHRANHPETKHYCEDVFSIDPLKVTKGRQVGLAWFSPDCTYHSKARGGKPFRDRNRARRKRGLAGVVVKWARTVKPRVLMLENVEEFQYWGPLLPDGRPCPERRGLNFRRWWKQLENCGYKLEAKELRGCDYGAPTIRKRLFIIARCDGLPIRWPKPTHGKGRDLLPFRTAAECIDWTIPCPSIFLTKEEGRALGVKRPLAEATQRRIAKGVKRFVIDAAEPFIVPVTHAGDAPTITANSFLKRPGGCAPIGIVAPVIVKHNFGDKPCHGADEPLHTITTQGNKHALVSAFLAKHYGDTGQRPGSSMHEPVSTITSSDHNALVAAFVSKYNSDKGNEHRCADPGEPLKTLDTQNRFGLVTSHLTKFRGTCQHGQDEREPLHTITGQGYHYAEVRAFLIKFYGEGGQWASLKEPMHTVPTKDRMGLVTIRGEDYLIADIGMRMLKPRELYRAQGFTGDYIIDPIVNGKRLTQEAQVRMVGNSVCPPIARALVEANFRHEEQYAEDVA